MPASITGQTQPWFTINEYLSKSVTSGETVSVERISAVAFDVDVNITIGALGTGFPLPAGTPIGIDTSTTQFSVDTGAFMFAMGGK